MEDKEAAIMKENPPALKETPVNPSPPPADAKRAVPQKKNSPLTKLEFAVFMNKAGDQIEVLPKADGKESKKDGWIRCANDDEAFKLLDTGHEVLQSVTDLDDPVVQEWILHKCRYRTRTYARPMIYWAQIYREHLWAQFAEALNTDFFERLVGCSHKWDAEKLHQCEEWTDLRRFYMFTVSELQQYFDNDDTSLGMFFHPAKHQLVESPLRFLVRRCRPGQVSEQELWTYIREKGRYDPLDSAYEMELTRPASKRLIHAFRSAQDKSIEAGKLEDQVRAHRRIARVWIRQEQERPAKE